MSLPVTLVALGVLVPRRVLAGETVNQNVVPAVTVEVLGVRKEVVGIAMRIERVLRIELMHLCECGTFVPERSGGDVLDAVLIEVPRCRAFAIEFSGKPLRLPIDSLLVLSVGEGRDAAECCDKRVSSEQNVVSESVIVRADYSVTVGVA